MELQRFWVLTVGPSYFRMEYWTLWSFSEVSVEDGVVLVEVL
jgi:hypothetical protein